MSFNKITYINVNDINTIQHAEAWKYNQKNYTSKMKYDKPEHGLK